MSQISQVTLSEHLDITEVKKMHKKLSQSLEKSNHIMIIGSKVERTDTAGIQLLLAFAKEIERSEGKLEWKEPSESLQRSAIKLGLEDVLGLGNE